MKGQEKFFVSITTNQRLLDAKGKTTKVTAKLWSAKKLAIELQYSKVDELLEKNPGLDLLMPQIPEQNLNPTNGIATAEALAILLKGISQANSISPGMVTSSISLLGSSMIYPPIVPWWMFLPTGSLMPLTSVDQQGCDCPCLDGITAEFTVEWDAPGPFNPDLFSDNMKGGRTRNPVGTPAGRTEEISGSTTTSIDFGDPNLGIVNTGDLLFNLEAKPFFANGLDDDCCVSVKGTFWGAADISNNGVNGTTLVSEMVELGDCEGQICCTSVYGGKFNKSFGLNFNTLNVNLTSTVFGIVIVTVTIRKK